MVNCCYPTECVWTQQSSGVVEAICDGRARFQRSAAERAIYENRGHRPFDCSDFGDRFVRMVVASTG